MSRLFVPAPLGMGTQSAESIISLVTRIAAIYRVSAAQVRSLACTVAGHPRRAVDLKTLDRCLGATASARSLVRGLTVLAERNDIGQTALYELGHVVGHGRGLVGSALRICPDCAHPETGLDYSLLATQLRVVTRCPIHQTSLNEQCLACGFRFGVLQKASRGALCGRCRLPLWDQHRLPDRRTRFEEWCELQTLGLVAYATSPGQNIIDESWSASYLQALTRLRFADPSLYSRSERVFVHARVDSALKRAGSLPSFSTVLRLCAMQAVSVVDFIRAPVEFCSPRLTAMKPVDRSTERPVHRDPAQWEEARRRVEQILQRRDLANLPSKRSLLEELGLTVSGFWQHFPDLALEYERRRVELCSVRRAQSIRVAEVAAEGLVVEAYESGERLGIRRGGEEVARVAGVSKTVAENAIRRALRQLHSEHSA